MSVAPGCVLPVPGLMTFDARPDGVFAASAGGAATSDGGVATDTFGACANRGDAIRTETARNESIRMSQGSFLFEHSTCDILPPNLIVENVERSLAFYVD